MSAGVTRLELNEAAGARALAEGLRGLVPAASDISAAAGQIVAEVRSGGDVALRRLAREHDGLTDDVAVRVTAAELVTALDELDTGVRSALELAIENVGAVARAGLGADIDIDLAQGQRVRLREVPVARAAIYVPGGRAPYPSSVVMGAVTAREAGVGEVVICAPGGHP